MSADRALLDWSDLYGDNALPSKNVHKAVNSERRASSPSSDEAGGKPRPVVPALSSAAMQRERRRSSTGRLSSSRNSIGRRAGGQQGQGSTPRDATGERSQRPITPRKIEQLAQPHHRQGRPIEQRTPNYGTLLSFSEEERRDAARRERRLNTPRKPQKETSNCTIPETDHRLDHLAQPKQQHSDPQPLPPSATPYDLSSTRPQLPDLSVYDQLIRPVRVIPEANVLGGGGGPTVMAKSPRAASRAFSKPRATSSHPPADDTISRLARPKQRKERVEAVDQRAEMYRSLPMKRVYGGTTVVDYSPTKPVRAQSGNGPAGNVPAWTNMQRPRPAPAATKDPHVYHQQCQDCERERQAQQQQQRQAAAAAAAAAALAAKGPVIVHSEPVPQQPVQAPPAPAREMPKPPLEVTTKRFKAKDDAPLWPAQQPEETVSPKSPAPVVAVRRAPPEHTTVGDGATRNSVTAAPQPPQGASAPPKPVPATVAIRHAKPRNESAAAAATASPVAAPASVLKTAQPAPLNVSAIVAVSDRARQGHERSTPSPTSNSNSNSNVLGQRLSVSTPRSSSLREVYKAPPARSQAIKVKRGGGGKKK